MSDVRRQMPRLRITKNGRELCTAGSEHIWTFSAIVWADIWAPEASNITVTGSRPPDDAGIREFVVWHMSHELESGDHLQFSFLTGSESSPLDVAPIERPGADEEKIDFFAPLPELEMLELEARPIKNAGCKWSFTSGGQPPIRLSVDLVRQHLNLHLLWNDHRPERLRASLSKISLREISSRAQGEELLLEHFHVGAVLGLHVGA